MKYIPLLCFFLIACYKSEDYGYLNTDRRPYVLRVSERYNNPPAMNSNGTWIFNKIIFDTLPRDIRASDYAIIPVDTIPKDWKSAWCSIDKIDSTFKIEIRKYIIK